MAYSIQRIILPVPGVEEMQAEARSEGYNFIESLVNDWESGVNRFDAVGEILCGCVDGGLLVGVGGLNCDPYAGDATVGRVRRIYVRQAWRGKGIGTALVRTLVAAARGNFLSLHLRAENAKAAALYERLGFEPVVNVNATHRLLL